MPLPQKGVRVSGQKRLTRLLCFCILDAEPQEQPACAAVPENRRYTTPAPLMGANTESRKKITRDARMFHAWFVPVPSQESKIR